jgi:hypothetical protein
VLNNKALLYCCRNYFLKPKNMKKSMKNVSKLLSIASVSAIILAGCSKSGMNNQTSAASAPVTPHHAYGLVPSNPAHYANVPVLSGNEIFQMIKNPMKLSGPEPATYSLVTPAVRNQEQIGSCTGFCGTEANEITQYYYNSNVWGPVLSPLYLYYIERVKIQGQKITVDEGAEMVDIPEALQKYGECIETDYAYPTNQSETAGPSSKAYKTAPTAAAVSNALLYEIGQSPSNYAMVAQGDTATVISLLRQNIPVCMGFNVYDNSKYTIFEGLNTTSYTYNPLTANGAIVSGASLLGGHANIIYGYNNTLKVFLMENSWGTDWGNNGYWYLPYSVFQSTKIVPTANVYWFTK